MNIYKLSQAVNRGYDTYDSCVVIAKDLETAQGMYPGDRNGKDDEDSYFRESYWATVEAVTVELIGVAAEDAEQHVVCASFNAGN